MLKKFKDVFQSLECSGHIDELLNFVFVEKVSASNDMSLIKINIIAERIIEKKTILDLEKLIKDRMFPKKNVKIKIFEKFKLSSQYTAQNLFETYRDSILLEIKNYKISQYVILNNACITFDGLYMDMTVEKNPSRIPPWLVISAIIFAVIIGMLAGFFPSLRAMKLSPLTALRND